MEVFLNEQNGSDNGHRPASYMIRPCNLGMSMTVAGAAIATCYSADVAARTIFASLSVQTSPPVGSRMTSAREAEIVTPSEAS